MQRQHSFLTCSFFVSDYNDPYTESPQDFLATEPEDIGQDIIFLTTQDDASLSEVTPEAVGEILNTQSTNPRKEYPVDTQSPSIGLDKEPPFTEDPLQTATFLSEHQESLFTHDTWDLIKKVSHPEAYLPAPEENPDTDDEESYLLSTASSMLYDVAPVENSTIPSTSVTLTDPEDHDSETESLDMFSISITYEADIDYFHQNESDLPVSQEDHTPEFHLELLTVTESSGQLENSTTEETSAIPASSHTEEGQVHATTLLPSFDYSTSTNRPTEEGPEEETAIPSPDEETAVSGTHSSIGVDNSTTAEEIHSSGSGEETVNPRFSYLTFKELLLFSCFCSHAY